MQQGPRRPSWFRVLIWGVIAYALATGAMFLFGNIYAGMSERDATGFSLGVGAFVSGLVMILLIVAQFAGEEDAH